MLLQVSRRRSRPLRDGRVVGGQAVLGAPGGGPRPDRVGGVDDRLRVESRVAREPRPPRCLRDPRAEPRRSRCVNAAYCGGRDSNFTHSARCARFVPRFESLLSHCCRSRSARRRSAGEGIRTNERRSGHAARCARRSGLRLSGFEPFLIRHLRLAKCSPQECGGRDSNPRTSTGADLKSAAFGQAQPPPPGSRFRRRGETPFGWAPPSGVGRAAATYQSTESVPSPCGSGAISSSVRRSTT